MSILNSGLAKTIGNKARAFPLFRRAGRLVDNVRRRLLRKPRTVTESPNLLPLLIQVLAAFSKSGAEVMEEETSYPIAASDIRRWALAVYYPEVPPAEFWDEDDPVTVARGGIVAPDEFNPLAWMAKDPKPDRHPALGVTPKVGAFEAALGVKPPDINTTSQAKC